MWIEKLHSELGLGFVVVFVWWPLHVFCLLKTVVGFKSRLKWIESTWNLLAHYNIFQVKVLNVLQSTDLKKIACEPWLWQSFIDNLHAVIESSIVEKSWLHEKGVWEISVVELDWAYLVVQFHAEEVKCSVHKVQLLIVVSELDETVSSDGFIQTQTFMLLARDLNVQLDSPLLVYFFGSNIPFSPWWLFFTEC